MIQSFHAHVYYRDADERHRAGLLRERIAERFLVQLGRWHDNPIGPHERGMYQVNFNPEVFPAFIPWLMLNRDNLTILLHPNTGHPRADHLTNSFWFGEVLKIENVEMLPEQSDEDERTVPNTSPTISLS